MNITRITKPVGLSREELEFAFRYRTRVKAAMPQIITKQYILDNQHYKRVGLSSVSPLREATGTRPAPCLSTNSE